MNAIICPVSTKKANRSVVRITGFLTALFVVLYAITLNPIIPFILMVDFIIRGFSLLKFSPLSKTASFIAASFHLKVTLIDKAPKLFAARVGLLFSISGLVLWFISPAVSLGVMFTLMAFALLESLFNFCVGCVVYTYVVLPLNNSNSPLP